MPYRSSANGVRGFCARCGSSLTFKDENDPDMLWLTMGSLDQPDAVNPGEHWFAADKLSWLHLDDDLPRYPAYGNTSESE